MTAPAAARTRRLPRILPLLASLTVLATLTALLGPCGAGPSQAAPTRPSATLRASTTAPLYGATTTLAVAVRKGAPRQPVALQVRSGSSWKVVQRARLPRAGAVKRVTFRLSATWAGTRTYRAVLTRTRAAGSTTTSAVDVTVRPRTWPVSTLPSGLTDGVATLGDVSGDGRFVVFSTSASDLSPQDPGPGLDVYLWDRADGSFTVVSHPNGSPTASDSNSRTPRISDDGRFVVFASTAGLDGVDGDGAYDVYRWSRATDTHELVSVGSGGAQSNGSAINPDISADGQRVVFESTATNIAGGTSSADVFLWEQGAGTPTLLSRGPADVAGNGASTEPSISADGRHVAFQTEASNLAQTQYPADANGSSDIVLWDQDLGPGTGLFRVSTTPGGLQAAGGSRRAQISGDGTFVAFESDATTINPDDTAASTDIFRWNRDDLSVIELVSEPLDPLYAGGFVTTPAIDGSGTRIGFVGDFDALRRNTITSARDVILWRSAGAVMTRESVSTAGAAGTPSGSTGVRLSDDGHWIVFTTQATNLGAQGPAGESQVFLRGPLP